MATIYANISTRAGINLEARAGAADVGGDKVLNTGKELMYINNASASPITLTLVFAAGLTIDGQTVSNRTVTLAAGKKYMIGPFPTAIYNDVDGYLNFTYSDVTTLWVAIFNYGT